MLNRVLPLVALLGLMGLMLAPVLAADENTHEGLVVKAGDNKLTMTDKEGKNEHTHAVSKDAKITCDSKACKLDELKKGNKVKVTTEGKGEKAVAIKIDATTK